MHNQDNCDDILERINLYKNYFYEARIVPQKLSDSMDNFLCTGEFTMMHAHYMTLQAEKLYKAQNKEDALYALGVVETILSSRRLLPTDRMYSAERSF